MSSLTVHTLVSGEVLVTGTHSVQLAWYEACRDPQVADRLQYLPIFVQLTEANAEPGGEPILGILFSRDDLLEPRLTQAITKVVKDSMVGFDEEWKRLNGG